MFRDGLAIDFNSIGRAKIHNREEPVVERNFPVVSRDGAVLKDDVIVVGFAERDGCCDKFDANFRVVSLLENNAGHGREVVDQESLRVFLGFKIVVRSSKSRLV